MIALAREGVHRLGYAHHAWCLRRPLSQRPALPPARYRLALKDTLMVELELV